MITLLNLERHLRSHGCDLGRCCYSAPELGMLSGPAIALLGTPHRRLMLSTATAEGRPRVGSPGAPAEQLDAMFQSSDIRCDLFDFLSTW